MRIDLSRYDYKDFMTIVSYLQDNWVWPSMIRYRWDKDRHQPKHYILYLELHTGGHSENEAIINKLLKNKLFCMMWYAKWERGGHFYFEINPFNAGWLKVSDYCKQKKISRQYVFQAKEKFEWIIATENLRFIKPKK
jgi:hypothetical protein